MMTKKMVEQISWEEFRESGFLWWINRILHTFGLVIVTEVDENQTVTKAYPAKTKFRGFGLEPEEEGFIKVSNYMLDNVKKISKDANE